MKDVQKYIVATVDKHEAIDKTPIYVLMVTKNIDAGDILEFDAGGNVVVQYRASGYTPHSVDVNGNCNKGCC